MTIKSEDLRVDQVIEILPMYGWGWRKGNTAMTVPTPFNVKISEIIEYSGTAKEFIGNVTKPDSHEFSGYKIAFSKRTEDTYNIRLEEKISSDLGNEFITGFAGIDSNSSVKHAPHE